MFVAGDTLGPYRIEREIGRGGMAVVYLAHHQHLERPVALKMLHPYLQHDAEFVERFVFEAQAAARLDHMHIVAIHDAGQIDGQYYIAMEYVPGESLADILRRVPGPLPIEFTLSVIDQVASALDYAHRRGVVHRDIKPSNILVRDNGHALLTDFGIARAASISGATKAGSILGTPEYMSPEQAEGHAVDGRSDVYSLAIVVYLMLTGQAPFKGDTPQSILYAHVHQPLPDPRNYQPDLAPTYVAALHTGAAKDPGKRYPTAGAFAQALHVASGRAVAVPVRKGSSRQNLGYGLIGLLLAIGVLALALWWSLSRWRATEPPVPTITAVGQGTAFPTDTALPGILLPTHTVTPSPTPEAASETTTPTTAPTETPTSTPLPTETPTPIPEFGSGRVIAYVSDRTGIPQIYTILSDGSGERQLTDSGRNDRPFWSGDGSLIFYTHDEGGGQSLWSMRADGAEKTELIAIPGAFAYSISPDGAHTLYALPTNEGLELILDGRLWTTLPGDGIDYFWSPDSQRIIYEGVESARVLYSLSLASNTPLRLTEATYSSWNPTWAPEGLRLSYASTRDGNAGIYVMAIDGGSLLRLTPLEIWSQVPSWAPDGSAIAHISGEGNDVWALYTMRADGSGRFPLYRNVSSEMPAVWSGDSQLLVFGIFDGDQELMIIDREGNGIVQLTDNNSNEWNPTWQPIP